MFKKIYFSVTILGTLNHTVSHCITDKKIISHSNTQLSTNFNTIQLHTPNHLNFRNLNKDEWWK